ncbi:hypothetical protein AAG565_14855 [Fontimonas sp. SYSU GA230001]|uniref:BP74-related protein n=1 Tax=Fontimonas sp. SYSU GA230001 TaxID=3142450 RepID=UPI0032B352A9
MNGGRMGATLAVLVLAACGGGDGRDVCCAPLPQSGLYATFSVGNETFSAAITDADGKAEARALWAGTSSAGIPNGELRCTAAAWNAPWSWHLAPDTIRFADVTTEVCDGTPSYVDAHCADFGPRYCPWSAQLTALRDCDADPSCPDVPR